MIETTQGKTCEACGRNEAVVVCNGCGKALCRDCRVFDIWGYGCGHGDPVVFCKSCHGDPAKNAWRVPD